jgi:hypothetical protein
MLVDMRLVLDEEQRKMETIKERSREKTLCLDGRPVGRPVKGL